jgi:hypothetical protein
MASESDIRVQAVITAVGGAESGGTTTNEKPLISGQGDPYATVDIYTSSTLLGSVTANGQGDWTFQPATPLFDGVHDLSAIQVSANGVTSATSYFAITVAAADGPQTAGVDTSSSSFTSPLAGGEVAHGLASFPINHFKIHAEAGASNAPAGEVANHALADLTADPKSFARQSLAHPVDGKGFDMLAFLGDHLVLDLTSLATKSAAQKSGISGFDLGGHHNALKLSLADVLTLGDESLFLDDGKRQVIVNGKEGDSVDLTNSHVAGLSDGDWEHHGTAHVDGVLYNVIEHSSAHTELLVEQAVRVEVH